MLLDSMSNVEPRELIGLFVAMAVIRSIDEYYRPICPGPGNLWHIRRWQDGTGTASYGLP